MGGGRELPDRYLAEGSGHMTGFTGGTTALKLIVLFASIFSLVMLSPVLASDLKHDLYYAKLGTPQLSIDSEGTGFHITQKNPSAGIFLVARPQLRGSIFSEAVILLTKHDIHGSIGLIINKPSDILLSEAFPEIAEFQNEEYSLYTGGPVELHRITALIRSDTPLANAKHIFEDIYAVSDIGIMKETLASPDGKRKIRFYSGWHTSTLYRQ